MSVRSRVIQSRVIGDTEYISTPPLNRYFHDMEILVEVIFSQSIVEIMSWCCRDHDHVDQ